MCSPNQLHNITQEVSQKAQAILGSRLCDVILYGSYARGDYEDGSDIDIAILANVCDSELRPFQKQLNQVCSDIGLETGELLTIFLYDEKLFKERLPLSPFYRNVLKDGVKIYAA